MLQIQMRILRVFGLSKAEMNSIIENAQAEGSPSLRLQEREVTRSALRQQAAGTANQPVGLPGESAPPTGL